MNFQLRTVSKQALFFGFGAGCIWGVLAVLALGTIGLYVTAAVGLLAIAAGIYVVKKG